MKHLKFFAVALTLMLGISFTSCLNGEDDPNVTLSLFARYNGGFYGGTSFTTSDGRSFVPTDPSVMLTLSEGMYNIYFQCDREVFLSDSKEVTITLLTDPVRLERLYAVTGSGLTESNSPLYAFAVSDNYGYNLAPALFDKYTMIYPAMFWFASVTLEDDYKEEFAKHKFTVTYEVKSEEPTVLYLYVNHNVNDEPGEVVNRTIPTIQYYELDITPGVATIESSGQKLSKIIMVGKCNQSSDNMDGAQEVIFDKIDLQDFYN